MSSLSIVFICCLLLNVCYSSDKEEEAKKDIPLSFPLVSLSFPEEILSPLTPQTPLAPKKISYFEFCRTCSTRNNLVKVSDQAKIMVDKATQWADIAELISPLLPAPLPAIIVISDQVLHETSIIVDVINQTLHPSI